MVESGGLESRCAARLHRGFESLSLRNTAEYYRNPSVVLCFFFGKLSEWFKEHAWKACVCPHTGGSNPPLSDFFSSNNHQIKDIKAYHINNYSLKKIL